MIAAPVNYDLRPWRSAKIMVASILLAAGLAPNSPLHGAALRDFYRVLDHGQLREFEVARDELYFANAAPGGIPGTPFGSAEEARLHAVELRRNAGAEVALVLYERGVPRNEFSRRILTPQVVVHFKESSNEFEIARRAASALRSAGGSTEIAVFPTPIKNWVIFATPDPDGGLALAEMLRGFPEVSRAEAQLAQRHECKFVPNDALFTLQWHLANTGQNGGTPGCDIDVTQVWDSWHGSGITIGVVDDGIQPLHPDLAPNLMPALGTNINTGAVVAETGRHGTAVAGLIGARGNNDSGVAGVAFESGIADIRLLGDPTTDAQDALAVLHANDQIQIKNNSWGARDGDGTLDGAGPLMAAALIEATSHGRNNRGTLFVFAGGNGRNYGENVNYDGYANSAYVIAVGSVTDQGEQSSYSEPGSCLAISAPSGSGTKLCSSGRQALTTTDLLGASGYNYPAAFCELPSPDYTQSFSGTSGATALVSGVLALMLQADPTLGWRDAKEILLRSARRISTTDTDWHTNSAGIAHNHRFGAGLINARGAVNLSSRWCNLAPLQIISQAQTNLNLPVPDNQSTGVVCSLVFTNSGFRVETVAVQLTLPHAFFGDLAVTLTSPQGTVSRLAELHNSAGSGYDNWTFTSVRHWGEPAKGSWLLKIADLSPTRTGILQSIQINLLGSSPQARLTLSHTKNSWRSSLSAPAPGFRYALEASTNLLQWQRLDILVIPETGLTFFDDLEEVANARFYRARLLE